MLLALYHRWEKMGQWPWRPEQMTTVHHLFLGLCEERLSRKGGSHFRKVTYRNGSALFDRVLTALKDH